MDTGVTGVLQAAGLAVVATAAAIVPGSWLVRRARRQRAVAPVSAWRAMAAAGWGLVAVGTAALMTTTVLMVWALWPSLFNDPSTYEPPGWRPPND
ncbi:MAG TPA: hypothetical protein VM734_34535 [Kofleriaceae bacterium]|nr:hypothetical protein [Kofleriaceae bacterium]